MKSDPKYIGDGVTVHMENGDTIVLVADGQKVIYLEPFVFANLLEFYEEQKKTFYYGWTVE